MPNFSNASNAAKPNRNGGHGAGLAGLALYGAARIRQAHQGRSEAEYGAQMAQWHAGIQMQVEEHKAGLRDSSEAQAHGFRMHEHDRKQAGAHALQQSAQNHAMVMQGSKQNHEAGEAVLARSAAFHMATQAQEHERSIKGTAEGNQAHEWNMTQAKQDHEARLGVMKTSVEMGKVQNESDKIAGEHKVKMHEAGTKRKDVEVTREIGLESLNTQREAGGHERTGTSAYKEDQGLPRAYRNQKSKTAMS